MKKKSPRYREGEKNNESDETTCNLTNNIYKKSKKITCIFYPNPATHEILRSNSYERAVKKKKNLTDLIL
jgi:hypothetical protein